MLHKYVKDLRRTKLSHEIEFYTEEGYHFEAGQEYFLMTHCALSLMFFLFYIPLLMRFNTEIKKDSVERNSLFIGIHCCIALRLIGYVLEIIDLLYFSRTGEEIGMLNFIGQCLTYGAGYGLSCFLIFVAHGWTLTFNDIDEFEFFLPVAVLIGIFKFILLGKFPKSLTSQGIARIDVHEPGITHRYDSAPGWFLVLF